jgi:hypothetical protein
LSTTGIVYDVSVMASVWKMLQKVELARPACPIAELETVQQKTCMTGKGRLFWRVLKPQLVRFRPQHVIDPGYWGAAEDICCESNAEREEGREVAGREREGPG